MAQGDVGAVLNMRIILFKSLLAQNRLGEVQQCARQDQFTQAAGPAALDVSQHHRSPVGQAFGKKTPPGHEPRRRFRGG